MTPWETNKTVSAIQKDRRRWAIVTAFHSAAIQNSKKKTTLEDWLKEEPRWKPPKAQQSAGEAFAAFAQFAGVKRKKEKADG